MRFEVKKNGKPPARLKKSRSPYAEFVSIANGLRKGEWIEVELPEGGPRAVASRVRALRRHLVEVNRSRVHSGPLRVVVTDCCIVVQEKGV